MQIIDVINTIAGDVPGCPEPELVNAYRNALIEFCKRTRCMRSWITTTTNDLISPTIVSDQQTLDILDALLDGEEIDCVGVNDRAVTEATHEDPVLTWTNANVAQIVPQPATARDLQMLLVFVPGPTASAIEDTIWMTHGEAIGQGALARLLAKAGRPYTDVQAAAFNDSLFKAEIEKWAPIYGARTRTKASRLRTRRSSI